MAVIPVVDGTRLTDLVHAFERGAGFERREESYAGLIPSFFNFGPAATHFLARDRPPVVDPVGVPLLGCECGEWGCWPLMARVTVTVDEVRWTNFEQPHRPDRDYSGFGPFVFGRTDYECAVEAVAPAWDRA